MIMSLKLHLVLFLVTIFECSEEISIASFESEKNSYEFHDLDSYYYFRYQIFQDEPSICEIQSSDFVGSVYKQSNRFDGSKT